MNVISRQQLQALLAADPKPILVEALPERYYRDAHLPGALHLPHDQVEALAPSLLPDRTAPIVVYCANAQCQNSHIAAHRLRTLGYSNVGVYGAGKQDWTDAGLPLERGAAVAV